VVVSPPLPLRSMSNLKIETMNDLFKSGNATENYRQKGEVNPMLIQAMLEEFKLDWYVKKEPMLINHNGELEETPYYATIRQDSRQSFASVKAGYEVFQNHELAELVYRVAGHLGRKVTRGGSFNGGGQVYLQIENDPWNVGNDRIQRWASGINSFDGSTALRWSPETNTISCENTFWMAYHSMENSVRHTTNMRQMIESSLKAIEGLNKAEQTLYEAFTRFTEWEAKSDHIKAVVQTATGIDMDKSQEEAEKEYSTRALNTAQSLMESIVSETNSKGKTLWGLWSGVTHFTTHKAGSERTRDKSKALGHLAKVDNTVFEMMKQLVYS